MKKLLILFSVLLVAGCATLLTKEDYVGSDESSNLLLEYNAATCDDEAKTFAARFAYYNGAYHSCMTGKGYKLKSR